MTSHTQSEEAIFLAAVQLATAQERLAYVQGACANDEQLLNRVSELLASHDASRGPLDLPPPGVGNASTLYQLPLERPGTQIGPYKLLQQIGEGGMGVVYMAEQSEPVQRKVALKVIKPGMDSRQVIARFEAERQALAMMDHVNIARVLDAGATESGRPYFVMELVHGVPITKYCDDNRLTPRQRLELFVPVCQAIQHAHQKGIIHRDIKPSNVMVTLYDGKPVPKVIDFGVAKATEQKLTERTLFTQYGTMVGTLEYMSPEQAEMSALGVDTRSDIYSLGVLLYELLTGSTPLDQKRIREAAYAEILRIIKEEEPPKPSTRLSESGDALASISAQRHTEPAKLSKLMRGELDWIVMKTLEKDRNRRYETANGFAADVQRYLNDEPVLACPPSSWYRFRKFARRNKGPMLAVAVVLLALVGGVIGTSWGMVRAKLARRLAEQERDEKDKARQLAETNEKRALKARDAERLALTGEAQQRQRAEGNLQLATAVLDEIIVKDARQRLNLYTQDQSKGLATNPEREKLERELLDKGLEFYEKLAQSNATDWAARRERAKAYSNIGFIQRQYRNIAQAEKAYRQATDLMEKLADERPEDFDNRFNLASDYFSLAGLEAGRPQHAEEITRHSLALFEKLAAEFPDKSAIVQEHTAYCHRNLGQLLVKNAKPLEAEQAFQQSIAIWSELATAHPKAAGYRHALANEYHLLANLYTSQKRFADADTAYQAARSGWEKLVAEFNDSEYHTPLGGVSLLWAFSCKADGRIKEAEKHFREAAAEFETLQTNFPKQSRWAIHELGYIYLFLGELLSGLGSRDQDAEKALRQSLAYHEQQLAQGPEEAQYQERVTWSYAALARLLRKTKRPMEASQLDGKRIELVKKLASTATQASEMNNLAWNLVTDVDSDSQSAPQAVEWAKKAVELAPTQGSYWNTLGTAHYRAGNWQAAIQALRKASELLQGGYFGYNAFFLAMAHWQLGEMEQASKWYATAIVWMEKHAPKNEELIRFRAEASALLGLPEELPPDQELAKADDMSFYTLVLEADPKAAWAHGARGSAYAEHDQWEEAGADFAKAVYLNESEPLYLYREALARLQLGDVTDYRQICAAALARLDPARKADDVRWPVWTCVLAADAVADWDEPLRLAGKAAADNPKSYRALNLHGAVLYRAGQYREALERLTEAEQAYLPDDGKLNVAAYNWLFLAMAHSRRGHVEEAKKWHAKAIQWIDQETQKSKEPGAANSLPWNRRLTLQLLRREAEELLKQK
jgi:eukaryotic-like serine/threonine-protein kinase